MKKKECVAFGVAVRRLRSSQGLSQEDFADSVEVHRTFIGGIERGERNPTLVTIAKIAAALGLKPSDLLREAERESRKDSER
jgi:transcriptional regulator with XRE-family HTH domain